MTWPNVWLSLLCVRILLASMFVPNRELRFFYLVERCYKINGETNYPYTTLKSQISKMVIDTQFK